jgi:hypothetical protein
MKQTTEERVLELLRKSADKAERLAGKKLVQTPEVTEIINIFECFLRKKKLIIYGGTAINNILPTEDQFYDKDIELPDYDVYSTQAIADARELADLYLAKGYTQVDARSGVHLGPFTYKVYVNFLPIADITQMDKGIFGKMREETISINGLVYAPPNYLRMGMYKELSRPKGDVSRWEKVWKRLQLLNKNYPIVGKNCQEIEDKSSPKKDDSKQSQGNVQREMMTTIRDSLISQNAVFIGQYAISKYAKYMPEKPRKLYSYPNIHRFDVMLSEPELGATILKEQLEEEGFKHIKIEMQDPAPEPFDKHMGNSVALSINGKNIVNLFFPISCHSFNLLFVNRQRVNIASIDMIMNFYLAQTYLPDSRYNKNKLLCICEELMNIRKKHRFVKRGILNQFAIRCLGDERTLVQTRQKRSELYKEFKVDRGSKIFEKYFFKYEPYEEQLKKEEKKAKRQVAKEKGQVAKEKGQVAKEKGQVAKLRRKVRTLKKKGPDRSKRSKTAKKVRFAKELKQELSNKIGNIEF